MCEGVAPVVRPRIAWGSAVALAQNIRKTGRTIVTASGLGFGNLYVEFERSKVPKSDFGVISVQSTVGTAECAKCFPPWQLDFDGHSDSSTLRGSA